MMTDAQRLRIGPFRMNAGVKLLPATSAAQPKTNAAPRTMDVRISYPSLLGPPDYIERVTRLATGMPGTSLTVRLRPEVL
jgi:hypothetical protein